MREEFTASSISGLDLIQDQTGIISRTQVALLTHKIIRWQLDATYTLDTFDDHGRYIPLLQLFLYGGSVVQWKISNR